MGIKNRLAKVAALSLTAGAVTIGGLGMVGTASADGGQQPPPAQTPVVRPNGDAGALPGASFIKTDLVAVAAQRLGLTADALRREMQSRSVRQIAGQRGVAYADLKTTLVNAENADLQKATADGLVTQSQANLLVSNIPPTVERFLNAGAARAAAIRGGPPAGASGQTNHRPRSAAPAQAGPNQAGPNRAGPTQAGPMRR